VLDLRLGKQHLRNGSLVFATKKGGVPLELPIPPELQRIIGASPTGNMTFLTTNFGKPFKRPLTGAELTLRP
jgi:hypothetical protein